MAEQHDEEIWSEKNIEIDSMCLDPTSENDIFHEIGRKMEPRKKNPTERNLSSADCEEDVVFENSTNVDKEIVDDAMHGNSISSDRISNEEPRVGMIFNTLDEAWDCWQNYGKLMGFGVRINYRNKSQKDGVYNNAVFVCRKESKRVEDKRRVRVIHRWEERTSCKAKLNVVLERSIGKYKIKEFVAEHNHELEPPETSHMLRSHRQVSRAAAAAINLAHDAGLTPKATHHLRIREAGGWDKVGYILEDQKTYLRSKREKNMVYGELGSIIRYFEQRKRKDPSFLYSMQFDSDELVTNIFWADSRMIVDYGDFGDVITFDTTYGTNKELRPLGVFTGFNHHRQMVIFGGALLYDETTDSFAWLFETFLNAHGGKEPQTIFTDQDAAMANALTKVLKKIRHGLCTWHLNQNGIKHLGWRMKDGSSFLTEFQRCMFEYSEEDDFEREWKKLLDNYDLHDNEWLSRTYGLKEKWAKCYMKYAFTLGIRSTQLSESLNSDLKSHLKCDMNISDFFRQFDRVVDEKRERELKADFDARQKIPPLESYDSLLLMQVSQLYIPEIFTLFQIELRAALRVVIKKKNEAQCPHEYVVCLHGSRENEMNVLFDPSKDWVVCSCRKFEIMGILCCHILKVFIIQDVMCIPQKYILARWTKGVKSAQSLNKEKVDGVEDVREWVQRLQSQLLRMTLQASAHEVTRSCMEQMVNDCNKQIFSFTTKNEIANEVPSSNLGDKIENMKGLKKKDGRRRTKRPKSWIEKHVGKFKKSKSLKEPCRSIANSQENLNSRVAVHHHQQENVGDDIALSHLMVSPN